MGRKIDGLGMGLAVSAWRLLSAPVDFQCGAHRLLVHVREALGRDPPGGSAYVFCHRRRSRVKVLVVDAQGMWLATHRLHQGRLV
ncbi:MAG: IS66 family insertion sequence element accessory protein TnpB [Rhodanobacter sp.]